MMTTTPEVDVVPNEHEPSAPPAPPSESTDPISGEMSEVNSSPSIGTNPSPADPEAGSKDAKLISSFTKMTGYEAKDVLASNAATRTVVTSSGGKYKVSPKGTQVKVLAGPLPPKAEEA